MDPLTALPARFIAGDSRAIRRSFAAVSPGDGYTVKLRFASTAGLVVDVTGAEEASTYLFTIATTTLRDVKPGVLTWTLTAEKTDERITLDAGTMVLEPDPANAATASQSALAHIERVIAACECAMENKMTDDVQMYQLPGGVTVSKMSMREVRETLAIYKAKRKRLLNRGRLFVREVGYARR